MGYLPLTYRRAPELLEQLAEAFHHVYQQEARRQAKLGADAVRHPDEYAALPEHTKDYDRALAIFVLDHLEQIRDKLAPVIGH